MDGVTGREGARIAESLAARVLQRVPALTDRLVDTIQRLNPGYDEMRVVPVDDLWQSCHDNITRVLQLLSAEGDGEAPENDWYFDAARMTGQHRAQQRMPLDDVLRSFRLGGRLVWEALIDQARQEGVVDTDGLLDVATRVWQVVDVTSSQVANAYHATERELLRADDQRKAALWEGLLRGRAKDLAFAYEASRTIDLPVDGPYVVVAADNRAGTEDRARAACAELAATGIRSAWQVRGETLVGLIALGDTDLTIALTRLQARLDSPAGLSFAVRGLAEADTGFQQATLARRTLDLGRAEVVALEERLPEALLLGSPDLAARLVRHWLGPLLDLPTADRQLLLDTIETWVQTSGSTARTAETMHCHRNTIINRLRRIRELTGQDLAADILRIELQLALRAWRLLRT